MSVLLFIATILVAAYSMLFVVYTIGWFRQRKPNVLDGDNEVMISVIIPARNESANIARCLQSLCAQNYNKTSFEVILIDDFSVDDTVEIAKAFTSQLPLKIIRLQDVVNPGARINAYKKEALRLGIESGTGTLILTTDADCTLPVNWLQSFANLYHSTIAAAIIAPVAFSPVQGLCSLFQSLDFMTMQGITAAAQKLNLGSMANGANFGFTRAAWNAVEGYAGSERFASGDDYHLLYKIKSRFPQDIYYLRDRGAIVATPPQPGWKAFIAQRVRWASKNGKYPDRALTAILLLVYAVNCMLLLTGIVAIFIPSLYIPLLLLLLVKTVAELLFLVPVSRFYNKVGELFFFPLLQPMHIIYIVMAGFLGMVGSYHWKGRRVS